MSKRVDRLDVRLTPIQAKQVRAVAKDLGRGRADTVRRLIEEEYARLLARGSATPGVTRGDTDDGTTREA